MIPEGYRLLTAEDVGKVFGVDLECLAHIDTEINPLRMSSDVNYTNFIFCKVDPNMELPIIYIQDTLYETSGSTNGWNYETATLPEGLEVTEFYTNYNWNDWFYVKDKANPKEQFITDMNDLAKSITDKAGSSGKKTIKEMKTLVDGLKTKFVTQEKTVTPTKSSQAITPDSGKDGLSKVTVNAIPNEYIIPSGSLNITENGTHNVTDKSSVVVNVPGETLEEYDGSWEISEGFTATFAETYATPADSFSFYSLDNGLTWNNANTFAYNRLEMEGVVQIKFKVTYGYNEGYGMYDGGCVVCEELGIDIEATSSNSEIITDNFILTQNINVSMGSAA